MASITVPKVKTALLGFRMLEGLPRELLKGDPKPIVEPAAHPAGGWDSFQTYLDDATGTRVRPGCTVTPLVDGQTAFPRMLDAIDKAKSSVNWSVYLFNPDQTGWDVARHLADAADRGCQVRLLYDQFGSQEAGQTPGGKDMLQFLRDHKVGLECQPIACRHVTHRKILTVDGSTGFIGGMNVGDDYSKTWHDIHSEVTGPAVADLQHLFEDQWTGLGGTMKADYPALHPTGSAGARIIGHTGHQDENMKLAYLRAIDTSSRSITIADPYVSDPDIYGHLEAASRRGVDVRLILPEHNNQAPSQQSEKVHYQDMLASGMKIFEYNGRPMAHDKVAVFDHRVATIGSSNLDRISLEFNDEANVWVDDRKVAKKLDAALAQDQMSSVPITSYHPGLGENVLNHVGGWVVSWV
jgi:cardiolipin synthase